MNTNAKQQAAKGAAGGGGRFQGWERCDHEGAGSSPQGPNQINLDTNVERAQTGLGMWLTPGINVPGTILPGSSLRFGGRVEGAD
ncbi:hypothetical protein CYMTET_37566 [Cymbomonas tetramitiformis]|uniref:Uncharacterized protein n=1 Tax=Cymbomonas tetramitiformis TaxID=36881 RepID=A0AAE0CF66_9CHLO|nr:hypothetical protein CYMTET_37566 [Cymbomonas tetramitiformis]